MHTRSERTIACARATAGLEWQEIRLSRNPTSPCKHSRPSRGFGRAPLATARPRWVRLALPHRQTMRFRARTQPVFGRWASLFVRRMCTNICAEWLGSMAETTESKVVVAMAKLARSQRDCISAHADNQAERLT